MRKRPTSEKEEIRGRRVSQRKRKRAKYYFDDDDDDDDEEDENEEEEDNEQPGPSDGFNQKAQEDKVWIVTCGWERGSMNVEKFQSGEPCIQCDDQCFLPHEFEFFGGKGSSKKWKASIRYKNEPLENWIKRGSLSTKGFKRGRTRTTKKKTSSSNPSSDSSSEENAEDSENDVAEEEDGLPGSEEVVLGKEEGGEERAAAENDDGDSGGDERGELTRVANGEVEGERRTAIEKELKVVIERLPEMNSTSKSDCMEHTAGASDTAAPRNEPLLMPVTVIIDEETEDMTQTSEGEEDAQRHQGPEAVTSQTPSTADARSEILNETDVGGSTPAHPSTSCYLDTMDLEQLKKEKIKMQLKVLKLQEEYYSLKIKEHKRGHKR